MAEFIVNEAGCANLAENMRRQLAAIQACVTQIDSYESTLRRALGPDYDAIASSMRIITAELQDSQQNMNAIIANMEDYIARVKEIRVQLNR